VSKKLKDGNENKKSKSLKRKEFSLEVCGGKEKYKKVIRTEEVD